MPPRKWTDNITLGGVGAVLGFLWMVAASIMTFKDNSTAQIAVLRTDVEVLKVRVQQLEARRDLTGKPQGG